MMKFDDTSHRSYKTNIVKLHHSQILVRYSIFPQIPISKIKINETNHSKLSSVVEFRHSMSKIQKENISRTNYPLNRSIHRIKFFKYIKQVPSYFIFTRN